MLNRLLATTGTQFEGWVILNLLGRGGGSLDEEELTRQLVHGLKIGEEAVRAAAAGLGRRGLISRVAQAGGSARLALTAAGTARSGQIQAAISEVTARLYGGLPETDLAIAHRVLATVTERANAELAHPGPATG